MRPSKPKGFKLIGSVSFSDPRLFTFYIEVSFNKSGFFMEFVHFILSYKRLTIISSISFIISSWYHYSISRVYSDLFVKIFWYWSFFFFFYWLFLLRVFNFIDDFKEWTFSFVDCLHFIFGVCIDFCSLFFPSTFFGSNMLFFFWLLDMEA